MHTPLMQLCAGPQTAHDGPHAVRIDEWVEHASPVPSGRTQMNWPAGYVEVGFVQTPPTHVCAAPQTAQDAPQADRFVEVEQRHQTVSGQARAHELPRRTRRGRVVQTPATHVCAAPDTVQDAPQADRLIEWVEQASRLPSARAHWNCPAGQVEGVVQTPLMHVCAAPQRAQGMRGRRRYGSPNDWAAIQAAVRARALELSSRAGRRRAADAIDATLRRTAGGAGRAAGVTVRRMIGELRPSRLPSARAHWNCPAGQVEGVLQTPLMQLCAAPQTAQDDPAGGAVRRVGRAGVQRSIGPHALELSGGAG